MTIDNNLIMILISASFIGAASGYLGSLMILRRMALVGDALSHVALPGIALALMINMNPFLGALAFLTVAGIGIWAIEERSEISTETLIGIFFTASLSIGIIMTEDVEILEALFGDITKVGRVDVLFAVAISTLAIYITKKISRGLLLDTISKDLAKSAGINTSKIGLIFLLLIGIVVALGIKVAGALLTGALGVIAAAAAKNISSNFRDFSILSLIFGVISAVVGIIIASSLDQHPGPIIVLTGTTIFVITFLLRK